MLIIMAYYILYKHRNGLWLLTQGRNIDKLKIDESMAWKVRFLNTNIFSNKAQVNIPKDSKVICSFKDIFCFDIYDKKMNHIHHFYNPSLIVLEEGKDLFSKIDYYFLIRYESSMEEKFDALTFFQTQKKELMTQSIYEIDMKNILNENHLKQEKDEITEKIISEMEEDGFTLEDIEYSEIRRSFPSDMLINEIFLSVESCQKIVVMVTNKEKIFDIKNHSVEFSSEQNNFIWYPEDTNSSFCTLILDIEDDIVEICISEYLYCERSKIFPITAFIFS